MSSRFDRTPIPIVRARSTRPEPTPLELLAFETEHGTHSERVRKDSRSVTVSTSAPPRYYQLLRRAVLDPDAVAAYPTTARHARDRFERKTRDLDRGGDHAAQPRRVPQAPQAKPEWTRRRRRRRRPCPVDHPLDQRGTDDAEGQAKVMLHTPRTRSTTCASGTRRSTCCPAKESRDEPAPPARRCARAHRARNRSPSRLRSGDGPTSTSRRPREPPCASSRSSPRPNDCSTSAPLNVTALAGVSPGGARCRREPRLSVCRRCGRRPPFERAVLDEIRAQVYRLTVPMRAELDIVASVLSVV